MKRRLDLHGTVVARPAPPHSTRAPSANGAQTGRPTPMEIIGLDRHKRERQVSINADDGTITDRRIATRRERLTAVLGARPRARACGGRRARSASGWPATWSRSATRCSSRTRTTRRCLPLGRDARRPTRAMRARGWRPARRARGVPRIAAPRRDAMSGPSERCAMRACARARDTSRSPRRSCAATGGACQRVRVRGCRRGLRRWISRPR